MPELRRITTAELRLLIRGAKARHSGTILIETPSAQAALATPASHAAPFSPGGPPQEGGWYWQHGTGLDSLPRFVEALARGPVPAAADIVPRIRAWRTDEPVPRFRDGRTTGMLNELVAVVETATAQGMLVVEVPDAAALDQHLLLLLRRILDRADKIRAIFLVHFNPPASFASREEAGTWAHGVAGLLDLCVKSRMWNRAGIVLDELLRRLHDLPDSGVRGHVLFRAGMAGVRQGRTRDAEAFYDRSLELLTEAGDLETLVKSLNNLGNLRLGERRLEEAEDCFARALKLGEELQSDYHLGVTYGNYARLWLERGRPDHARAQLQKSIIFTVRSGYYHHAHYTYATLADVLVHKGDLAGAEEMMKRAITVCERQENLVDLAGGQVRLGRFYVDQGRLAEAAQCFELAGGHYRRLGSSYGRMILAENLAALRLAEGDPAGALRFLEEADKVAAELGNSAARTRLLALSGKIGTSRNAEDPAREGSPGPATSSPRSQGGKGAHD